MTSTEYALWLARTTKKAQEVEREEELHDYILSDCRRRGWIALHGSMAHRTHRTEGEPDFVILAEKRVLLVEAKRPGGKCSPTQNVFRAWAAKLGHIVHVVTNMREFIAVVSAHGGPGNVSHQSPGQESPIQDLPRPHADGHVSRVPVRPNDQAEPPPNNGH